MPGSILAEKYRVERVLGQGGMGVVVQARHIALDELVALKFLLPEYASHPDASARFLREARAAVKIKSEHVARVSDVGTLETGAPYMVMEFLEGSDLSRVLTRKGVLSVEDAVDYVIQGCEAIAEAHSYGIVHRDIKPANLFLSQRPNGTPIVKVLDFGISKFTEGDVDNLTRTSTALGSALYMSPEQMQQTRGVDHRTDIYALGITLYELLAARQPFYADTLPQLCAEIFTGTPTPIRAVRPDVSEVLAWVLEKAYARDRAHRIQTVAEFAVALAPFAPARSQSLVESIAKMGGLSVPAPGTSTSAFPQQTPPGGYPSTAPPQMFLPPVTGSRTGAPVVSGNTFPPQGLPAKPRSHAASILVVALVAATGLGTWVALRNRQGSPAASSASAASEAMPVASVRSSAPTPSESPTPAATPTGLGAAMPSATADPARPDAAPSESSSPAHAGAAAAHPSRDRHVVGPAREPARPGLIVPSYVPSPANTIGF